MALSHHFPDSSGLPYNPKRYYTGSSTLMCRVQQHCAAARQAKQAPVQAMTESERQPLAAPALPVSWTT
jgi:hypothetical protein